MSKILYTQSNVANRPTWYSQKFGNLLSDTYQASVDRGNNGTWNAWVMNLSRKESNFRLGLRSKGAATRWANNRLRELGIWQP